MSDLKRNQVEEAISQVLEPWSPKPSPGFRTRLKRLLETDRALGPGANEPGHVKYAFYRSDAPGSGVEVWFSEYETFALAVGLGLMAHGWPQSTVVTILRGVRPELEAEHARILQLDRKWLFDQEAIRRNAQEGDIAFNSRDPVLLITVSKSAAPASEQGDLLACSVCRGANEAMKFYWDASGGRGAWTMFEVTTLAWDLSEAVARTRPRRRGRGA